MCGIGMLDDFSICNLHSPVNSMSHVNEPAPLLTQNINFKFIYLSQKNQNYHLMSRTFHKLCPSAHEQVNMDRLCNIKSMVTIPYDFARIRNLLVIYSTSVRTEAIDDITGTLFLKFCIDKLVT